MITLEDLATNTWGARMPKLPELALAGAFFEISAVWQGRQLRDENGRVRAVTTQTALRALNTIKTQTTSPKLRARAADLSWQIVINSMEPTNVAQN